MTLKIGQIVEYHRKVMGWYQSSYENGTNLKIISIGPNGVEVVPKTGGVKHSVYEGNLCSIQEIYCI